MTNMKGFEDMIYTNQKNFPKNKISRTDLDGQACVLRDALPGLTIKNACARAISKIRDEPKRNCSCGLASKGARHGRYSIIVRKKCNAHRARNIISSSVCLHFMSSCLTSVHKEY